MKSSARFSFGCVSTYLFVVLFQQSGRQVCCSTKLILNKTKRADVEQIWRRHIIYTHLCTQTLSLLQIFKFPSSLCAYLCIINPVHGLIQLWTVVGYGCSVLLKHSQQRPCLQTKHQQMTSVFFFNLCSALSNGQRGFKEIEEKVDWSALKPTNTNLPGGCYNGLAPQQQHQHHLNSQRTHHHHPQHHSYHHHHLQHQEELSALTIACNTSASHKTNSSVRVQAKKLPKWLRKHHLFASPTIKGVSAVYFDGPNLNQSLDKPGRAAVWAVRHTALVFRSVRR